jgi:flagella basal body P-ring formation protein FlgA
VKTPLRAPVPGCPTICLLLLLACFLLSPCPGAQSAPSWPGDFADRGACGDPARMTLLKQRVLAVIREDVRRRTSPDPVTVEDQDLQIQACPPQVDSEFVIMRAEYDAARDITVFYLAASRQGTIPPFIVTVKKQRKMRVLTVKRDLRNGQAVSMNDFLETTRSSGNLLTPEAGLLAAFQHPLGADAAARPASKLLPAPDWLVKVGRPSVLLVRGKNFVGRMTVVPLQSGRLGEEVQVRDPGTQNILRATVSNTNQLEEIF